MLHIIPAAGKATRIGGIPKFLLPIEDKKFLLDFHVRNISIKKQKLRKVVAVSKEFYETINRFNFDIEVLIVNTNTMNETVLEVINSFPEEEDYLLTMPDTFFWDNNIADEMFHKFKNNVDGTLGIWEILESQKGKLGQCKLENDFVTSIKDKDKTCNYEHSWGAIMWNKSLNKFINKEDPHIGYMAQKSIESNFLLNFHKGQKKYYDCGTFQTYKELIKEI